MRDVFGRIPAEGRWRHVLLADGNVGIGGDPAALLRRVAALLADAGTALVELDPPGTGLRREAARLEAGWFPWARLAVDAIDEPACAAGFRVSVDSRRGRPLVRRTGPRLVVADRGGQLGWTVWPASVTVTVLPVLSVSAI